MKPAIFKWNNAPEEQAITVELQGCFSIILNTLYFNELRRVGKVPQWLRVLAVLSEDLNMISGTLMALTTLYNSSPRGSRCPLLASMGTAFMWCTNKHKGKIHIQIKIDGKIVFNNVWKIIANLNINSCYIFSKLETK